MGGLSRWQTAVLLVPGFTSAVLSIFGSSLIAFAIAKRGTRQLRNEARNQLLLGLSFGDFISALALGLGPFLVPQGSLRDNNPLAFGTPATCSAAAFFYVFGSTVSCFYNCWISIHFWRIVQERQKQRNQQKRENLLRSLAHLMVLLVPLLLSCIGVITNSFHPHEFLGVCYFGDNPTGCSLDTDIECLDKYGFIYGWITIAGITILGFLSIGFAISLTRKVRASFSRSGRYSMRNLVSTPVDGSNTTSSTGKTSERNLTTSSSNLNTSSRILNASTRSSMGSVGRRSSLMRRLSSIQGLSSFSMRNMPVDTRQREVALQAFWYILAYLNTFVLPVITIIVVNATDALGNEGSAGYFLLLLCLYSFMPLQGGINFFVFIRPRYIAWKAYLQRQDITTRSHHEQTGNDQASATTHWYKVFQLAVLQDVPPPRWQRRRGRIEDEELGCAPTTPTIPALDEEVLVVESDKTTKATASSMPSRLASLSSRQNAPMPPGSNRLASRASLSGSATHRASEKFFSAYLSTCFSLEDLDDSSSFEEDDEGGEPEAFDRQIGDDVFPSDAFKSADEGEDIFLSEELGENARGNQDDSNSNTNLG